MTIMKTRFVLLLALPLLGATFAAGCGGEGAGPQLAMAPLEGMPNAVRKAPKMVREAYRFAVANPEVLSQVPCYCGCGGMGHTSNYSCFVSVAADGSRSFDGHALGCSICVDIARDTMRMLKEGKNLAQIRLSVDLKYSRYGPSNMM